MRESLVLLKELDKDAMYVLRRICSDLGDMGREGSIVTISFIDFATIQSESSA